MIIKVKDLKKIRKKYKNKKIVFTSGVFDLFHVGHLRYLKNAKKLGDILVVNVVNDKRAKILKGNHRPIINQKHRAEIIGSLKFVDYVLINPVFNKGTSTNTIKILKPDINYVSKTRGIKKYYKVHPKIKIIKGNRHKITSTTKILNKIKK